MNIALLTPSYPPYRGGMGNAAFHFAEQLRKRGDKVTVFTPKYKKLDVQSTSETHFLRPLMQFGNAAAVPQVVFYLRHFDTVYAHIPFIGVGIPLIIWKLLNPRKKLVVHYQMDLFHHGKLRLLFLLYAHIVLRLLVRVSDMIIVSSMDYAKHSNLHTALLKDKIKLNVVANGVDCETFKPTSNIKHEMLINSRYVLFVGGLDSAHFFKGVPELLRAWHNVTKVVNDATLVLVGSGNHRESFKAQSESLGIGKQVKFVGNTSDDDLKKYYQGATVTVLPSTTRGEAFGIVLVESLASGTPILASNLPGVRTLVETNKNGWLVTPGSVDELTNALIKSLTEDISVMRIYSRQVAKLYDWEHLGDQLYTLLHK